MNEKIIGDKMKMQYNAHQKINKEKSYFDSKLFTYEANNCCLIIIVVCCKSSDAIFCLKVYKMI